MSLFITFKRSLKSHLFCGVLA